MTKPKSGASDINNKKIMIIIIIIRLGYSLIPWGDKVTLIQISGVRHEYNHDDETPYTAAKTSYENHQQILLGCSHNTDTDPIFKNLCILLLNDMYQTEIGKIMFQYKTGLLPDIHI